MNFRVVGDLINFEYAQSGIPRKQSIFVRDRNLDIFSLSSSNDYIYVVDFMRNTTIQEHNPKESSYEW
jgi:hypothetical protein